jgi:hypothetical protein
VSFPLAPRFEPLADFARSVRRVRDLDRAECGLKRGLPRLDKGEIAAVLFANIAQLRRLAFGKIGQVHAASLL